MKSNIMGSFTYLNGLELALIYSKTRMDRSFL